MSVALAVLAVVVLAVLMAGCSWSTMWSNGRAKAPKPQVCQGDPRGPWCSQTDDKRACWQEVCIDAKSTIFCSYVCKDGTVGPRVECSSVATPTPSPTPSPVVK